MSTGARIIVNSRYFKVAQPGERANGKSVMAKSAVSNLVNYVGTRETVALNIDPKVLERPVTDKQIEIIKQLAEFAPDITDTHEWQDFIEAPTIGNASQVISRMGELAQFENPDILPDEVKNLVEYVGSRPSVVKVGDHGIFGLRPNLDIKEVMDEVSSHTGRIWTHVISLRREDADRLGYDSQAPWRQLVMKNIDKIAKESHISLKNIRWYAGMHNTGHHPHIHLFVYSSDPKEGYINEDGLKNIKSAFANDIFKDEMQNLYMEKTLYRDQLKQKVNDLLNEIDLDPLKSYSQATVASICKDLEKIADTMPGKGKKVYRYQPLEVKKLVDNVVSKLVYGSNEMNQLYAAWCNEQSGIESFYLKNPEKDFPVTSNSAFYSLKNTVIKEAFKIKQGKESVFTEGFLRDIEFTPASETVEFKEPEPPENEYIKNLDEDFETAVFKAQNGDISTAYDVGQMYFYGTGTDQSYEKAMQFYSRASAGGHAMAAYQLAKMHYYGIGTEKDTKIGTTAFQDAYSRLQNDISTSNNDYEKGRLSYLCGKMMLNGEVGFTDLTKALEHFKLGAEHGHTQCAYQAGKLLISTETGEPDYKTAFKYFLDASKSANDYASYQIGKMFLHGNGTEQSYDQALSCFLKTATGNKIPSAYAEAAKILETGKSQVAGTDLEGAAVTYEKAAELYEKQGDKKFASIYFYKSAKLYLSNNEIKDIPEGKKLLEAAAKHGHANALYSLGYMYKAGEHFSADPEKSQEYFKRAYNAFERDFKENPSQYTAYQLGMMNQYGTGTQKNTDEAVKWYKTAADKGSTKAEEKIQKILYDQANSSDSHKQGQDQPQQTQSTAPIKSLVSLVSHASKVISSEALSSSKNNHTADQKTKMQTHMQKVKHGHNQNDLEQEVTY